MYNGKLWNDAWSNLILTHENQFYDCGFERGLDDACGDTNGAYKFIMRIYKGIPTTTHFVLSRESIFGVEIRNAYNGNK